MITVLLGILSVLVLSFLSILHIYWAFGGKWGFDTVLPTNNEGKRMLNPKPFDSIFVGIVLAFFAFLYLIKTIFIQIDFLPDWIYNYGMYIVSGVFMIRAIGDFKYVGFFKSVKNTKFARSDTKYFAPLCLFLGVIGFLLEFMG